MIGIFLNLLPPPQVGTVKRNHQLIVTILYGRGHVHPFWGEHVIRLQDSSAVEDDGGEGVQAVKSQDGLLAILDAGSCECGPVDPLLLAYPLDLEFILADIRIRDEAVV